MNKLKLIYNDGENTYGFITDQDFRMKHSGSILRRSVATRYGTLNIYSITSPMDLSYYRGNDFQVFVRGSDTRRDFCIVKINNKYREGFELLFKVEE